MAKSTIPSNIVEKYFQSEREIKIKGEIKTPVDSPTLTNLIPNYQGSYNYGNTTMTINNENFKIMGTSEISGNYPNYPSFTLPAGKYKLKLEMVKNTYNGYLRVIFGNNLIEVNEVPNVSQNLYAMVVVLNESTTINLLGFYCSAVDNHIDMEFNLYLYEYIERTETSLIPAFTTTIQYGNTCELKINNNILTMTGNNGYYTGYSFSYAEFTLPAGRYAFGFKRISGSHDLESIDINKNGANNYMEANANEYRFYEFLNDCTFNYMQVDVPNVNTDFNDVYELVLYKDTDGEQQYDTFEIGQGTIRPSYNLLNSAQFEHHSTNTGNSPSYKYEDGKLTATGYSGNGNSFTISTYPNMTLPAGTYTFSIINGEMPIIHQIEIKHKVNEALFATKFSLYGSNDPNGITSQTITLDSETSLDEIIIDFRIYEGSFDNDDVYFMLNEGSEALEWEPAGATISPPQILDFNVNEKSDLYCQTFPISELSIEVENQQGYFSDFTSNSIVSELNNNSYITFYLNIDDTGWYQAWEMQFDSIKATNEKATLKFKPYPMSVFKSLMYDENKYFTKSAWAVTSTTNDFKTYVLDNYGIIINGISSGSRAVVLNRKTIKNLSNLLFYYGTMLSTITQKPRLLMSLRNNNQIWYNDISWNNYIEIDYDFLLEKPILTKETLDEIVINTKEVKSYTSSTIGYTKTISGNFINDTDTIVIYGDGYIFNGITTNDITLTNATLESLNVPNDTYQNYLILEISGTAGEIYQIDINANLYHEEVYETTQEVIRKSNTIKSPNKIEIDNNMTSANDYWKLLLEKLDKKIQFKIPALPDLEVGDIIKLNYDNETNEKYIITEIKTSWNNGFIMNIIGYHLNEN